MQEPTPESYNPPVTRWGHVWRTLLCIAISGFVWSEVAEEQWKHAVGFFWLDIGLGLLSFGLMFYRRRWPLTIAVILTLFGFLSGLSSGPGTLAAVSLATRRRYWQIVLVGALGLVGAQVYTAVEPQTTTDRWWIGFSFVLAFTIAMMGWGMYLGSRRELIWTLRERATAAEHQQGLRIAQARSLERERIAREMHDVLAHRISLVTMHAGALAYRTDLPPEQVRATAEIIQSKAHEALTDLREVLGFLRDDSSPVRPQPTLADLDELVEEAVASGMTVELSNSLAEPGGVPEGTGRTVYRIVQEGLTNARKHATGTHVDVTVRGSRGEGVEVCLVNPIRLGAWSRTPGAGLGLVGLRERAELAGGTLEVVDDRATFAVRGWLPWPS